MALDYRILSKKKQIEMNSSFDGAGTVKFHDLLSKCMNDIELTNSSILVVEKEYIARPDLISLALYGTDKFADIICKINGISNPFELNEDMILICPSITELEALIYGTPEANDLIKQDTENPIFKTNNNNKKMPNDQRSPIEATVLDNNYTFIEGVHGLVFY